MLPYYFTYINTYIFQALKVFLNFEKYTFLQGFKKTQINALMKIYENEIKNKKLNILFE